MQISTVFRWIVVGALFSGLLWIANVLAAQIGGWIPHAVSHLTGSVVGAVLVGIVLSHYQRPVLQILRSGMLGARVFIAGAALFSYSQLVEALSAVIEYPKAGIIHAASGLATAVGLLILLVGALLMVFGAVAGRRLPSWALMLAVFGAAFVLFAAVFGLG